MPSDTEKNNPGPKRVKLETKAFWIAFEMIFVFGVPAVLAVLGSRRLIAEDLAGDWVLYAALAAAFLFSWVIVIIRVRKLSTAFKQTDKKTDADS